MGTKAKALKAVPTPESMENPLNEAEIDRFLASEHDRIEAKLTEARESITRGDVSPMEPLSALLRAARRNAKRVR